MKGSRVDRQEETTKPDFSGEYVLNRDASVLSALGASNFATASLRIDHNDADFRCEGNFSFRNHEPVRWSFELATDDASARQGPSAPGIRWEGASLVVTIPNEGTTLTFRYEFDREGRLRLAEQLRGTDHDQVNLWVFDRV